MWWANTYAISFEKFGMKECFNEMAIAVTRFKPFLITLEQIGQKIQETVPNFKIIDWILKLWGNNYRKRLLY